MQGYGAYHQGRTARFRKKAYPDEEQKPSTASRGRQDHANISRGASTNSLTRARNRAARAPSTIR